MKETGTMNFDIKNLRTMRGEETPAFSGTLYVDGKKAAELRSAGIGGPCDVDWTCGAEVRDRAIAHITSLPLDLTKYKMDVDTFLFTLVERIEERKKIARMCKGKTLFRTPDMEPGAWRVLKVPFTEAARAHVQKIAPGAVIANEILARGEELP